MKSPHLSYFGNFFYKQFYMNFWKIEDFAHKKSSLNRTNADLSFLWSMEPRETVEKYSASAYLIRVKSRMPVLVQASKLYLSISPV